MPAATEKSSQVGQAKDRLRRGRPIQMSSISLKYKRVRREQFYMPHLAIPKWSELCDSERNSGFLVLSPPE